MAEVWQISAGPADRSYADVFLSYGVGLIGPGDSGPWKPGEEDFAPIAYANLARLKESATDLFARLRRP